MIRRGYLTLTLRSGYALGHVPSYVDHLLGAARAANSLDGGLVQRAIDRWGMGCRCHCVYHARRSLGRPGEHHVGFDEIEERLGLSRTYHVELANPAGAHNVIQALRELAQVEAVMAQSLATIPFSLAAPAAVERPVTREDLWRPHERVHVREAWAIEPGLESVAVGVVDTGVALGHIELQRKLMAGFDTVDMGIGALNDGIRLIGDSRGSDFCPRDEVFHGSHVAGVIGAQGWEIAPGVAGRCLILPIRVLAAAVMGNAGNRSGVGGLTDIDSGMKVCVDLGADVINMSFGTAASAVDPHGPLPHQAVVQYAAHYGCTLVAAAGNSGRREMYYPAALPEVIAVASVDQHNRRSAFSTYGDHIALSAPGERIVSIGRRGYKVSTGTSHAAPFVSGVAALLVAHASRAGRRLAGSQVRQLLIESATPLSSGFDPETGHGLLNAGAALHHLKQRLGSSSRNGRPL
jgi:subtilisin family serine protease